MAHRLWAQPPCWKGKWVNCVSIEYQAWAIQLHPIFHRDSSLIYLSNKPFSGIRQSGWAHDLRSEDHVDSFSMVPTCDHEQSIYLEEIVFLEIPHDWSRSMSPEIVHQTIQSQKPADHNQRDQFGLISDSHQAHHWQTNQVHNQIFEWHCKVEQSHEHKNEEDST